MKATALISWAVDAGLARHSQVLPRVRLNYGSKSREWTSFPHPPLLGTIQDTVAQYKSTRQRGLLVLFFSWTRTLVFTDEYNARHRPRSNNPHCQYGEARQMAHAHDHHIIESCHTYAASRRHHLTPISPFLSFSIILSTKGAALGAFVAETQACFTPRQRGLRMYSSSLYMSHRPTHHPVLKKTSINLQDLYWHGKLRPNSITKPLCNTVLHPVPMHSLTGT